jgi:hypothetical protein
VEQSVEDFAQKALIKIVDNLNSFREESRATAGLLCGREVFVNLSIEERRMYAEHRER